MNTEEKAKLLDRLIASRERLSPTVQRWIDDLATENAARSNPRRGIAMCAAYMAGGSLNQIAAICGVNRATVAQHVRCRIPAKLRSARPRNKSQASLSLERVEMMISIGSVEQETDPIRLAAIMLAKSAEELRAST